MGMVVDLHGCIYLDAWRFLKKIKPTIKDKSAATNFEFRTVGTTALWSLCILGVLCDQQFGRDEHKVDTKDRTFIAHTPQPKSSNFCLLGLPLMSVHALSWSREISV